MHTACLLMLRLGAAHAEDEQFCRTFAAKVISNIAKRNTAVLGESGLDLQLLTDLVTSPACSNNIKQLLVYALVKVRFWRSQCSMSHSLNEKRSIC